MTITAYNLFNMVLNFHNFRKSRLNESESYSAPGIIETWNGGYKISTLDLTADEVDEVPRDRVIIPKKNETSIALSYIDSDGEESDYFWIPKDACSFNTDDEFGIKEIVLDPYKKWVTNPTNRERLDDFIEEFSDSFESSKLTGQEKVKTGAQDDVEIILDLLGIPGSIESFDSCGDYIWDANLHNGMLVEITKRSSDDLLSKFKIFLNSNDREPCMYVDNSSSNKKTIFNIPNLIKTEIPSGILSNTNIDPYISYLIKRATNNHDVSDQESLVNYFKSLVDSGSGEKDLIRRISSLLEEFMDKKDIEDLHPNA